MRVTGFRSYLPFFIVLLLTQLNAPYAAAQAWLPAKHNGTVSLTYKNFYIKDHADMNGLRLDRGRVRTNVVVADVDYGLTRRWAVNLSVPYSVVKYTGDFAHVDPDHPENNLDNGNYHGGVQDLRFGTRYALVRYSPVVVTPFAELVIPSHDYITFAHSAIGRNLNELMVGTNIGWRDEESFLPNAYFQTRISYSFVERVLDRSHNRTNIDTEFSYFVVPRLALSAYTSFTKHHGGLNWDSSKPLLAQWTPEEYLHHDELARADSFDIGMGTSFQLNGSTSVYGTLIHTTWAHNGHPLNTGVIVGVTRNFRTRRPVPLPQEPVFLPVSPQVR